MRDLLKHKKVLQISLLFLVLGFVLSPYAMANYQISQASVIKLEGEAKIMKAGTSEWSMLSPDAILKEGDKIKTAANTELILELTGGAKTAEVTVRPNTEMTFDMFRYEAEKPNDQTLLDVTMGGILIRAEKLRGESKFEVKTPTSIAGIRGTTFEVQVS